MSPGTGVLPPREKPCSLNAETGILLTCAPGLTALVLSEMTAGKLTWQSGFCSVESQTSDVSCLSGPISLMLFRRGGGAEADAGSW